MSRFEDTVQKLASSPVKSHLVEHVPRMLKVSAKVPGSVDWGQVVQSIASTVGGTALTASGAGLIYALQDRLTGNPKAIEAQHQEQGKLNARAHFQQQNVMKLQQEHDNVFSKIKKDEVISKADQRVMNSAYATMKRFAPNLAADENAALSFLREHAIYGTGPSYASLKNLAEAEKAVAEAGGASMGGKK